MISVSAAEGEKVRQLAERAGERLNTRWGFWLAVGVLALVHAGGVCRYYPPSFFVESQPIVSGDFASYFPAMSEVRRVHAGQGGIAGYSPSFMAGYPFGNWGSVGRKGFHLASLVLSPLSVEQACYLYVVLTLVVVPLLMLGGAWLLEMGRLERVGVMALGVFLMQVDHFLLSLWSAGTLTVFLLASSLMLVYLGALHRCLHDDKPLRYGCLGAVTLGSVVFIHPLIVIPLFITGCVSLVVSAPSLRSWRRCGAVAFAALGGWVLVLPHLLGLFGMIDQKVSYPASQRFIVGIQGMFFDLLMDRAYLYMHDRRLIFQAVILLGMVGGVLAWRQGRKGLAVTSLTGLLCLLAAYGLSIVPFLRQAEPYRYVATATLTMALPAVLAVGWISSVVARMRPREWAVMGILGVLLAPSLVGYAVGLASWQNDFRRTSIQTLEVVESMRDQQPVQARILCENETIGSVTPHYLNAEVIGGYHSGWFPMTYGVYAHLSDRRVFGRSPEADDAYDPQRLQAYFDLYNIGLIVAETEALQQVLETEEQWREVTALHGQRLFVRDAPGFVEGLPEATVRWADGELVVEGLTEGAHVLRYHYFPWLQEGSANGLEPVKRLEDPAPFIQLEVPAGSTSARVLVRK